MTNDEFYAHNDEDNGFRGLEPEAYRINNLNRAVVMAALRSVGCGMVRINFSGGGDDGQIDDNIDFQGLTKDPHQIQVSKIRAVREHTYLKDSKWERVAAGEEIPNTDNLHGMLMEFSDDIVGGNFPYDWCNNDGGSGTIEIRPGDVLEDGTIGSITVLFTQNITTTEDHKLSC